MQPNGKRNGWKGWRAGIKRKEENVGTQKVNDVEKVVKETKNRGKEKGRSHSTSLRGKVQLFDTIRGVTE